VTVQFSNSVVMAMSAPDDNAQEFRPMGRMQAMGLRIWGPADSHDNPLYGTKYDPILRQRRQQESLAYRRERWERRKAHFRDVIARATPRRHRHA